MPDDKPLMTQARSDQPSVLMDFERVRKALPIFRVMAVLVGLGLLLLVAEVILKYGFDNPVLAWWQIPHGFLYMVYLGAVANLGFAARWSLGKMVGVMLAGVVPLLSFWVEHKVSQGVQRQLDDA